MKKIIFVLAVIAMFAMSVGMASAVDDQFTVPSDFNDIGSGIAPNDAFQIYTFDYDNDSKDLYFTNEAAYQVSEDENHIWRFSYDDFQHQGCLEVVQNSTGDKFVIEISCDNGDNEKCYEYMLEFNELNGLEPLQI